MSISNVSPMNAASRSMLIESSSSLDAARRITAALETLASET